MNNKPWAYVTSAWSTDRTKARRSAKRYCRKLYEAGYTPICPLLSLPEVIDVSNADEYKDKNQDPPIYTVFFKASNSQETGGNENGRKESD